MPLDIDHYLVAIATRAASRASASAARPDEVVISAFPSRLRYVLQLFCSCSDSLDFSDILLWELADLACDILETLSALSDSSPDLSSGA